jgi:hypothetical protein
MMKIHGQTFVQVAKRSFFTEKSSRRINMNVPSRQLVKNCPYEIFCQNKRLLMNLIPNGLKFRESIRRLLPNKSKMIPQLVEKLSQGI